MVVIIIHDTIDGKNLFAFWIYSRRIKQQTNMFGSDIMSLFTEVGVRFCLHFLSVQKIYYTKLISNPVPTQAISCMHCKLFDIRSNNEKQLYASNVRNKSYLS